MTGRGHHHEPDDPDLREAAFRRWLRRVDVVVVVLLGAASFLAAWAGYQAGVWAGKKNDTTLMAEEFRSSAARASIIGYQERQVDIARFLGWLEAYSRGDTRLAGVNEARFTNQLRPAFAAWIATDPPEQPRCSAGPVSHGGVPGAAVAAGH